MDVAQKLVLIIGDSLSASTTSPGAYLAAALRAKGAMVRINAKVGRSARSFLNLEDGAKQMAREIENRPDIVILVLGTNDLVLSPTKTQEAFQTIRDTFRAHGIPVIMIGPPSFADSVKSEGKSFNELAKNIVVAGWYIFQPHFIDARPMTADIVKTSQGRAGDLIHFTKTGAQLWIQHDLTAMAKVRKAPAFYE